MELLEPFFIHAESRTYPLAPASELDSEAVHSAIATATGKTVTKVVFVSKDHPFPRPDWMTEEAYQDNVWVSLQDSLGPNFQDSLGPNLQESVLDSLKSSFVISHDLAMSIRVEGRPRNRLILAYFGCAVVRKLWDILGSIILGNTEKSDRLTPLIRLLPRAIPLGEKKDEPGTWLVLVA